MGVDRKSSAHPYGDAPDPDRTSASPKNTSFDGP